jgi:xanthine dehydrogenase accessory factor
MRKRLSCWLDENRRVAAAFLVEREGSTPQETGLRLLVNDAGEIDGAISGGCVDGAVVELCHQTLADGKPRAIRFHGESEVLGDPGLLCGGAIRLWIGLLPHEVALSLVAETSPHGGLFLEGGLEEGPRTMRWENELTDSSPGLIPLPDGLFRFQEPGEKSRLALIVGRSGFTESLSLQAALLGFTVYVCEPRQAFAGPVAGAAKVLRQQPETCLEELKQAGQLKADSVILVCTHEAKFDGPALRSALRSPAGFVGAMGSRRTIADRKKRLTELGLSAAEIARLHSPLGLDLGGHTPAETAVSVFAEIIAAQHGGSGLALSRTAGPIHRPAPPKVALVLLAAGGATRFGADKLSAKLGGRRVLDWSLAAALDSPARPIFLVVRPGADFAPLPSEVESVTNPNPEVGLSSSVHCGLQAARNLGVEAVLFAPADQPFLSGALYRLLWDHFAVHRTSAVAAYQGERGNPVLLAASDWTAAESLTGDRGLSALLPHIDCTTVECGDLGNLNDIDQPSDLAAAEETLPPSIQAHGPTLSQAGG